VRFVNSVSNLSQFALSSSLGCKLEQGPKIACPATGRRTKHGHGGAKSSCQKQYVQVLCFLAKGRKQLHSIGSRASHLLLAGVLNPLHRLMLLQSSFGTVIAASTSTVTAPVDLPRPTNGLFGSGMLGEAFSAFVWR